MLDWRGVCYGLRSLQDHSRPKLGLWGVEAACCGSQSVRHVGPSKDSVPHSISHVDYSHTVQIPIIFSGATFIVGAAIMACAVHISMIIIGRLILGLGVGVGSTVSAPRHAWHALAHWVLRSCTLPGQ